MGFARYRIHQQVRASSASFATLSCGHGDAKLNLVVLGVRRARAQNVAFGQHLAPELEQTQGNQRREDLRDNEDAKHRPQEVAQQTPNQRVRLVPNLADQGRDRLCVCMCVRVRVRSGLGFRV